MLNSPAYGNAPSIPDAAVPGCNIMKSRIPATSEPVSYHIRQVTAIFVAAGLCGRQVSDRTVAQSRHNRKGGTLDSPMEILQLVASGVIGYLLGALPFAQWVSRYIKGVDIFSTGTTLAGTANVFWNVGRRSALLVFIGDVGKGSAAVAVAWALGVEAPLTLVAAAAAIIGHWVSVFSSFRGGDGMTPLIGVSVALVPVLTVLAAIVGVGTVLLLRKHYLRSAWGICTGFLLMLGLSLAFDIEPNMTTNIEIELVAGLTALAALVLIRSMIVRRRLHSAKRQGIPDDLAIIEDLDVADGLGTDPELQQEIPGRS